ncbi:MAG TPA: YtxH domain-containing protein [Gemmatimonadaceae bacterium]|jgi:gas vesicle protein|nr:YtxH domain-containing protein [Gemmatimonadaceae bacterium]
MDERDWYDDDPYVERPYVIVERGDAGAGIGPLLLGLALGAGVALLLAPQSGEETRRAVARRARRAQEAAQDFVEDVSGTVADKFNQVRASVEERIDATFEAVDAKKRQVSNAVEAGRAAARQTRGELEHRIAERKAAYKDS